MLISTTSLFVKWIVEDLSLGRVSNDSLFTDRALKLLAPHVVGPSRVHVLAKDQEKVKCSSWDDRWWWHCCWRRSLEESHFNVKLDVEAFW